jgi:hypothetical protein
MRLIIYSALLTISNFPVFAQDDAQKCLARPGIVLCTGDVGLTGDPNQDKCAIAQLDLLKANLEEQQETSPDYVTQPPPYTHSEIEQHVHDAQDRINRDCPK